MTCLRVVYMWMRVSQRPRSISNARFSAYCALDLFLRFFFLFSRTASSVSGFRFFEHSGESAESCSRMKHETKKPFVPSSPGAHRTRLSASPESESLIGIHEVEYIFTCFRHLFRLPSAMPRRQHITSRCKLERPAPCFV